VAPEVIELTGTTSASDIWFTSFFEHENEHEIFSNKLTLSPNWKNRSVGCTVIELISGDPPYSNIPPMSAMFKIVQDDHPPLPSPISEQYLFIYLFIYFEKFIYLTI